MFCVCTLVLLVFLDGLNPCLFPCLVMFVGGVVCLPGAVLESVASGVCVRGWCQSVSVCVLLLEVCVCRL